MKVVEELYSKTDSFWQNVIDELRLSFKEKYKPMSSSVTIQEIGGMNVTPVKMQSQGFEITIVLPYYWDFMDSGVSGAKQNTSISKYKYRDKLPPIKAMRLFMLNRGIVGSNFRQLRSMPKTPKRQQSIDEELNRVAYAIAYTIWKRGLQPTHWVRDVINDNLLRNFEEQILAEYGRLIIDIKGL
jgi:hypothetical protein